MAPTKTAQTARIAVIVGGSCTVAASPAEGNIRVTDSITFGTEDGLLLNAPGIPNDYRQSTPIQWTYGNEMDALAEGAADNQAELLVIDPGGNQVTRFSRRDGGLAMAGVVLDTGKPPATELQSPVHTCARPRRRCSDSSQVEVTCGRSSFRSACLGRVNATSLKSL